MYYYVPVYKYQNQEKSLISYIIIKTSPLTSKIAHEVSTGKKITIISEEMLSLLNISYSKLYILMETINKESKVTKEELKKYLNNYSSYELKDAYDEIVIEKEITKIKKRHHTLEKTV